MLVGLTEASPEYKGSKNNRNKIMMELVDLEWVEDVAAILTYGAEKYAPGNWKQGLPEDEIVGAILRHIKAYRSGERYDPETGFDHRAHACCEFMFWMMLYPAGNRKTMYKQLWNEIFKLREKKKKEAKKKKRSKK